MLGSDSFPQLLRKHDKMVVLVSIDTDLMHSVLFAGKLMNRNSGGIRQSQLTKGMDSVVQIERKHKYALIKVQLGTRVVF